MNITERKITKIAREVSKFTVRTLRAESPDGRTVIFTAELR